jgi:Effector-associated domain 1
MKISGEQRKRLQLALLGAFPKKSSLQQMLSFELDKNLDTLAYGENLTEIIFQGRLRIVVELFRRWVLQTHNVGAG